MQSSTTVDRHEQTHRWDDLPPGPPQRHVAQDLFRRLDATRCPLSGTPTSPGPVALIDGTSTDPIGLEDGDEVLVWQSTVAAGEHEFAATTRHIISLCLVDMPEGFFRQGALACSRPLRAGQLVITVAGTTGHWRSSHECQFLSMALPSHLLQSTLAEKGVSDGLVSLRAGFGVDDLALGSLLKALHPELHAGRPAPRSFVQSVARAVCMQLGTRHRQPLMAANGLTDEELGAVIEHLRACIDSLVSLGSMDAVARQLGMNTAALQRRFKQRTGQTLLQYWLRMRLTQAHEMLKSARLNVTEVAMATGFADLPHFSRHFRRQFGVPPSALRCR